MPFIQILLFSPLWVIQYYILRELVVPLVSNTTNRCRLASQITSLVHASVTTLSSAIILATPYNIITPSQLLVLSSSYFVYDILYMVCYSPSRLFIIHHLATLAIWNLCLVYQCGEILILFSILIGEYTNVIRIPWRIAKESGSTELASQLEQLFKYNFLLARCVFAPIHILCHLPTIANLPMPLVGRLSILVSGGILITGSLMWAKRVVKSLPPNGPTISQLITELYN